MALTKQVTEDYEVRGEFKTIQKRTRTAIMEDGAEISYKYHRTSFMCDTDVSGESAELKALAGALWTDEIKKAYEASKD
tara:strand:- start:2874 stop:3110 length:237 start_codon:yes stop_codon:yes gene_type:complete